MCEDNKRKNIDLYPMFKENIINLYWLCPFKIRTWWLVKINKKLSYPSWPEPIFIIEPSGPVCGGWPLVRCRVSSEAVTGWATTRSLLRVLGTQFIDSSFSGPVTGSGAAVGGWPDQCTEFRAVLTTTTTRYIQESVWKHTLHKYSDLCTLCWERGRAFMLLAAGCGLEIKKRGPRDIYSKSRDERKEGKAGSRVSWWIKVQNKLTCVAR